MSKAVDQIIDPKITQLLSKMNNIKVQDFKNELYGLEKRLGTDELRKQVLNARDKGGNNLVLLAAYYGRNDLLDVLNGLSVSFDVQNTKGYSPLMQAVRLKKLGVLRTLSSMKKGVTDIGDQNNYTPLMEAARIGDSIGVLTLLEADADVTRENKSGKNALVFALEQKRMETAYLLIQAGAVLPQRYKHLQGEFQQAQKNGSKLSLIQPVDANRNFPIHNSAWDGKVDEINGYNGNIELFNSKGYTPLIQAARKNRPDAILALYRKGAHLNKQDHRGFNALMWTAYDGSPKAAEALIQCGASLSQQAPNGKNALVVALERAEVEQRQGKRKNYMMVAKLLIEHNVTLPKKYDKLKNMLERVKNTPLDIPQEKVKKMPKPKKDEPKKKAEVKVGELTAEQKATLKKMKKMGLSDVAIEHKKNQFLSMGKKKKTAKKKKGFDLKAAIHGAGGKPKKKKKKKVLPKAPVMGGAQPIAAKDKKPKAMKKKKPLKLGPVAPKDFSQSLKDEMRRRTAMKKTDAERRMMFDDSGKTYARPAEQKDFRSKLKKRSGGHSRSSKSVGSGSVFSAPKLRSRRKGKKKSLGKYDVVKIKAGLDLLMLDGLNYNRRLMQLRSQNPEGSHDLRKSEIRMEIEDINDIKNDRDDIMTHLERVARKMVRTSSKGDNEFAMAGNDFNEILQKIQEVVTQQGYNEEEAEDLLNTLRERDPNINLAPKGKGFGKK